MLKASATTPCLAVCKLIPAAISVAAFVVPEVTRVKSLPGKLAAPLFAALRSSKYLKLGPPPPPETLATVPSSFLKNNSAVSVLRPGSPIARSLALGSLPLALLNLICLV